MVERLINKRQPSKFVLQKRMNSLLIYLHILNVRHANLTKHKEQSYTVNHKNSAGENNIDIKLDSQSIITIAFYILNRKNDILCQTDVTYIR